MNLRKLGIGSVGWSMLLMTVCGGIGRMRPVVAARPADPAKAWLEARNMCIFPLGGPTLPQTTDGLAASLSEGMKRCINLASDHSAVAIDGDQFPRLKAIRIDLTDASDDLSKTKIKVKRERPTSTRLLKRISTLSSACATV